MDTRIIAECAKGQTFRETLRARHLLRWPEDLSRTFYVNYGGDDGADGLSPETELETLTAAIAKCENWRHDRIYVRGWYNNEDCPISIDKHTVRILTPPSASLSQPGVAIAAVGNTPVFSFEAAAISVEGFILDAGADHPCISFSGSTLTNSRQGVYNCDFRTAKYGIQGSGGTAGPGHYFTVKGCTFCELLTAGGIYLTSNGSWGLFVDNFFDKCPGQGMFIANQNAGRILHNRFACRADAIGAAITMSGTAQRFIIDDNRANYGDTAMSNNPYLDQASQAVNHWMMNYQGITAVMPQL